MSPTSRCWSSNRWRCRRRVAPTPRSRRRWRLFLERAAAAGAALEPGPALLADVAELCRRLDGLPLAIELAAARTRSIAPGDLLGVVDQRLDVLRRNRGAGDRHDSMRAAIELSTSLLNSDERRFFRRLGVFTGPFDLALATAVAGDVAEDRLSCLDKLLAGLVEQSLVTAETYGSVTRYRLLELLREHALDELAAAGESRAVRGAVRGGDGRRRRRDRRARPQPSGIRCCSARRARQYANLVKACELCLAHDSDPDRAYRLLLPMFAAVHEGRPSEVLAARRCASATAGRTRDAPWRIEVLAVLATAAAIAGRARRRRAAGGGRDRRSGGQRRRRSRSPSGRGALAAAPTTRSPRPATSSSPRPPPTGPVSGRWPSKWRPSAPASSTSPASADGRSTCWPMCCAAGTNPTTCSWSCSPTSCAPGAVAGGDVAGAEAELADGAARGRRRWASRGGRRRSCARRPPWPRSAPADGTAHARRGGGRSTSPPAAVRSARSRSACARRRRRPSTSANTNRRRCSSPPCPASTAITVLPELFPEAMAELIATAPAQPVGVHLRDALERARAALDARTAPTRRRRRRPRRPPGRAGRHEPELVAEGDSWRVGFGGRTVRVRDMKGVARPGGPARQAGRRGARPRADGRPRRRRRRRPGDRRAGAARRTRRASSSSSTRSTRPATTTTAPGPSGPSSSSTRSSSSSARRSGSAGARARPARARSGRARP